MVELIPVSDAAAASADGSDFDAVVAVGRLDAFSHLPHVERELLRVSKVDAELASRVTMQAVAGVAGGRLVVAPVGTLDHDTDDVRRFRDAAADGIRRARDAGARRPLLVVSGMPKRADFARAVEVGLLGALGALWQPLEAREARGDRATEPTEAVGFAITGDGDRVARWARAVESGRRLARDLGGTEPERMAPPRFAELCAEAFRGSAVKVEVVSDPDTLREEYPLLMAVGRASMPVERHRPRVVRLQYEGSGPIARTLLFAGKGVVYDTGGADLKVGGHMAGMSRDKCGAAAVAGFLQTVAQLTPEGVRVIAEIGLVRNSIGSDAYVSDEIVTSHAGVRVRVGNTDAEGRMVLADLLSHLRERAQGETRPAIFSVATLTGHAALAVGPYTAAVENGPARDEGIGSLLSERGDLWGEPLELSRSRREDFEFIKPRSQADDVLQCNNKPSSQTPRGHQFPMAFLCVASGLGAHGRHSGQALPYTHLDVAGSAAEKDDFQHGRPTGAPIVALAASFLE